MTQNTVSPPNFLFDRSTVRCSVNHSQQFWDFREDVLSHAKVQQNNFTQPPVNCDLTRSISRRFFVIAAVHVFSPFVPQRFVAIAYRPEGGYLLRRSDSFRVALELLEAALMLVDL